MKLIVSHKWIFISLALSSAYWVLETVRDVLIFNRGSFFHQLFHPDPISFWIKLLVVCMIVLSGAVIDHCQNKNNLAKRETQRSILKVGFILSLVYWFLAATRDSLLHSDITFAESIATPPVIYFWMRILGIFMIMLLSLFAHSSIINLEKEKAEIEKEKTHVFQIINQMVFPIQLISPDGVILQVNNSFKKNFPTIAEMCKDSIVHISEIQFYKDNNIVDAVIKAKRNRTVFIPQIVFENSLPGTAPERRIYETTVFPIINNQKCWVIIAIWTDITDKIDTENQKEEMRSQLLKAQKMEAIGNLAGGIAHDFNNLITAIQGTAELAIMDINEKKSDLVSLKSDLRDVINASRRAADLTNQLLLFSRRRIMGFNTIQINDTITNLMKIIKRLLAENISVKSKLDPSLWTITGDEGTIEQVIMNLVVNAKDAMPEGGEIVISTENIALTQETAVLIPEARPGKFICLTVSDTGTGIPENIMENIFEPFFTTKEAKNGTGLGLSVAYGIIQQHKGWINVYSEKGSGTIFKIYIPASDKEVSYKKDEKIDLIETKGYGEKILVVEDDESVRLTAVRALRRSGYIVTSAMSAEDALNFFINNKSNFDLVLSDVVLPGKSGIELAHNLKKRFPEMEIILGSGYTDAEKIRTEVTNKGFAFIQKPYEIFSLLKTIRQMLKEKQEKTTV